MIRKAISVLYGIHTMSLRGLEPLKQAVITPALEVALGKATVEQVHQRYEGMEVLCPHCLQEWMTRIEDDEIAEMMLRKNEQSLIERQLFTKEQVREIRLDLKNRGLLDTIQSGVSVYPPFLRVRFRRGCLDKANIISRWMHWAHTTHRSNGDSKRPCYDPGNLGHDVAVGAIELTLQDEYKASSRIQVEREKDLVISPGVPPLKRRPDLVVREDGRLVEVFEIQRSVISKESFIERTLHLRELCANVHWIFFRGTYKKMAPQRRWLNEIGLPYYYLFLDEKSRVVVEEGKPPKTREHRLDKKTAESVCRYDDPNDSFNQSPNEQSGAPLPLSTVGAAIFRTKTSPLKRKEPQFPRWNCSLGDEVEASVKGQWVRGKVSSFAEPDTLFVYLRKTVAGVGRYASIKRAEDIRPYREDQQQPQNEGEFGDQLGLFPC